MGMEDHPRSPAAPSAGTKRPASDAALEENGRAEGSEAVAVAAPDATKRRGHHRKVPKQHRVGNFRSYYNYRLGPQQEGGAKGVAAEADPRLALLRREWFEGKRGLDVGCNSGDLTIAIAKTLAPAYILGVDVDPQLVATARGNLKEIMQRQQVEDAFRAIKQDTTSSGGGDEAEQRNAKDGEDESARTEAIDGDGEAADKAAKTVDAAVTSAFGEDMPLSFRLWKPPQQAKDKIPKALGKAALSTTFPSNVVFKREDIAKDSHAGKDYGFITCFSVTKWIHLFHGDDGIKRVFRHFHDLLAPGGRLLLEPQPWKSYHKRKFTSDVTATNYAKIKLRPKDFPAFLTESVGFKSCTFLQVCQTSTKGFRRPMYVAEK